jgi:hypothetical protein
VSLPREHPPVLLVMAAFSRYDEALRWGRDRAERDWGPVALASDRFDFRETGFYERTMGPGLFKELWAFAPLVDPVTLVERKLQTNRWEEEYREQAGHPENRPLNLDPGYLTEAKLVLATTKDRDHRLYLGRGIFAEVTLSYHAQAWQTRPWTYPDYCRADYHHFFSRCREFLRRSYGRPPSRGQSEQA